MHKKQLIVNVLFFIAIIVLVVISFVCFSNVFTSHKNGTLKVYYRTIVIDGNISNLHWDYGRGDAPVVGGNKLCGKTAYIYNLSDNQCDVIIVSERNLYGESIGLNHFDADDIEKAQNNTIQHMSYIGLLSKEVFEYSKLSRTNLTKSEVQFRNCYKALTYLCLVIILENTLYLAVKKMKSAKSL